jgi:hypothetical protein
MFPSLPTPGPCLTPRRAAPWPFPSTPTLATQLGWWAGISGVGSSLHTMATQPLLDAPSTLSDPTSSWPFSQGVSSGGTSINGQSSTDQSAADAVLAAEPNRRLFSYNGQRPGAGSCATEDDGVALREQPWGQYKKKIDRWFWWEATYYDDNQQGLGSVDLFNSADTFGTTQSDPAYGMAGGANGNGVFFYPGTDTMFPANPRDRLSGKGERVQRLGACRSCALKPISSEANSGVSSTRPSTRLLPLRSPTLGHPCRRLWPGWSLFAEFGRPRHLDRSSRRRSCSRRFARRCSSR